MKKLIVSVVVMMMSSLVVNAQSSQTPKFWIDLGPGAYFYSPGNRFFYGEEYDTGFAADLGARWLYMFTENVGWDVVKLNAQTDVSHFKEVLNIQAKTGLRLISPVVFGKQSLYLNVAGGIGRFMDQGQNTFVWEVGAGVNISNHFSIGAVFNRQTPEGYGTSLASLRLSYGL